MMESVIQKRVERLVAVEPTSAKLCLKVLDEGKSVLHEETRQYTDYKLSDEERGKYYWGHNAYLDTIGLSDNASLSTLEISYEVLGVWISFHHLYRPLKKINAKWEVGESNGRERYRPLIQIMPDYGGAYAWDETGLCIGCCINHEHLSSLFDEDNDVFIIASELCETWQLKFEKDVSFSCEGGDKNFDWDSFHAEGLALTMRLKGVLGERADVIYEKPFEDPNRKTEEMRFIVPKNKDWLL